MKSVLTRLSGRGKFAVGALALGLLCLAVPTAASAGKASVNPDCKKENARHVCRYDIRVSEDLEAGAASASVRAPTSTVRAVVTDFAKYSKIISNFKQSRIVGKTEGRTDVYLQVPILKGAAKIWAVVRFEPPQNTENQHIVRAKMIKGNVKRLDAVWRINQIDEKHSELELQLFIVPDFYAPRSLLLSEVRAAAAKAVSDARKEAERRAAK